MGSYLTRTAVISELEANMMPQSPLQIFEAHQNLQSQAPRPPSPRMEDAVKMLRRTDAAHGVHEGAACGPVGQLERK